MRRPILRLLFVAVCIMFVQGVRAASSGGKYTRLINGVSSKSSEEIFRMAAACEQREQTDSALVLYMVVCNRMKEGLDEKERTHCAEAYLKSGDIYYDKGDYSGALEMYIEGLKVCETGSKLKLVTVFYKNIGKVYCLFQDYERGLWFYRKGYDLCRRYGDTATERKLLINLTGLCIFQGKLAEARKYHEASVKSEDEGDYENKFMNDFNHCLILSAGQDYRGAIAGFKSLAEDGIRHKAPSQYVCSVYQELYRIYGKLGQNRQMLYYLDKCWNTATEHGIQHMYVEVLDDYSRLYQDEGNVALAQQYKSEFLTMSDSIYNIRRFDMVKSMQLQYEMSKADKEITMLYARQQSREQVIFLQRVILAVVMVVSLLVTVLLIVVYRQKRRLDRSYADLYAVNRKYIDKQEVMKARHQDALKMIEQLKDKLAAAAGTGQGGGNNSSHTGVEAEVARQKPLTVGSDERMALVEAITAIMENTEEFCSADFSIERLATLVGSNQKYVSQVINSTFNKSFRDYVNEYRVALACKRLADGGDYANLTTKAIGESLGYKSHTSFINIFRKLTGLTPAQYQKIGKESV